MELLFSVVCVSSDCLQVWMLTVALLNTCVISAHGAAGQIQ